MFTPSKLTDNDIFQAILEILNAERYISIPTFGKFILINPTGTQKLQASFIEKTSLEKYIEEGYLSESELPPELLEEFFSIEDQENLEEVQSKIKAYSAILNKRLKDSPQYIIEKSKIEELLNREKSLLDRKSINKTFTAQYKAREDRYLYLMSLSYLKLDRTKLWDTFDEMSESTIYNMDALNLFLSEYLNFYLGYDTIEIRQIARSPQWKAYYRAATSGLFNLFSKSAQDLSLDQVNLLAWSMFYHNIEQMPYKDRPGDEIIEDDEKLDSYLERYNQKLYSQLEADKNKQGKNKADDHSVITPGSDNYIALHKQGAYSDTDVISGRAKEGSNTYNEKQHMKEIKDRNKKSKRV